MAVAAGVVDVALPAAGVAGSKLAPEGCRAAALDRAQRAVLNGAKPVRGAKRCAVPTHDVGELDPAAARARLGRVQGALPGSDLGALQQFQR